MSQPTEKAVAAALALADAGDDINKRLAAVRLLNATAERGDEPVDLAAARILAAAARTLAAEVRLLIAENAALFSFINRRMKMTATDPRVMSLTAEMRRLRGEMEAK